jgi:hypothetical protein
MEHSQHDTDGQTKVLEEKLVPLPVCALQILHGLVWKLIHGFSGKSFELYVPGHGQDVSEKCCHKYMIQIMLKVKYVCSWQLLACDTL